MALALPVGLLSQTAVEWTPSLLPSVVVLMLVVLIGIVFDVVGVAVTAAREAPLHARAARRVFGAREAAGLVRQAHRVASFCNDVVGDVSGTLSGALGIAVVLQVCRDLSRTHAIVATSGMAALVAGVIVGGKALGKVFAIRNSTEVVMQVGRLLAAARAAPLSRRAMRRRGPSHGG